jgi:hypothetical protein
VSKLHTRAPVAVSEGGLEPPPPSGTSPLKLSGSTDTSVALADIPKGSAGGWSQGFWPLYRTRTGDLRLARERTGAFLKVLVTRVETPADQGERVSVPTAGYPGVPAWVMDLRRT